MKSEATRRVFLLSAVSLVAACATKTTKSPRSAPEQRAEPDAIAELQTSLGGRVGVFALDTGSGRTLSHRADERFAMCSTFKWALAAAVLEKVDRGELALDERVPYGEKDVLDYAPATKQNLAAGFMTLEALAEAAVTVSDNTAANLLLDKLGGPDRLTAFFRRIGDAETRLDRNEPTLNTNLPGDPRDTTTPRAMVQSLKAIVAGAVLSSASRERLIGWMKACKTGLDRLRAGLPPDWVVADKTGSGERGAANDVAILWPPRRPPIVVAAYLSDSSAALPRLVAAHAEIGRVIAATL